MHQHVINNNAVTDLLETLEQVHKVQPLTGLRWTLGHVYDISAANIARAKAMGMTLGVHGAAMQAGARMPLRRIADSGIVFGLGTDATIVSHYSPFVTLGWVVSGLDVGGNKVLDETLTREEALIAHTRSNAYLFFQEKALGSLEVGKQADLVVLDRDYMNLSVISGAKNRSTNVTGTTNAYFESGGWKLTNGRWFSESELRSGAAVCIIGQTTRNELLGSIDPIGSRLRLRSLSWTSRRSPTRWGARRGH